ncbi:yjeF N-terminal domain-containing protein 3 [Morphnus guianensis]
MAQLPPQGCEFSSPGCRDPDSGLSPEPDFTVPSITSAAARWSRHTLFPSAAQCRAPECASRARPRPPAAGRAHPQPCKPPARSPGAPEHPLPRTLGTERGPEGLGAGGGGDMSPSSLLSAPPPQQGGGRGHREGAAGGLPVWAAAADRDLGTCLCHGRDQGCWYVELAAASLQAGGEPRPAAGIVPLLGIILNPPWASSSHCGSCRHPTVGIVRIPPWEPSASHHGHHPHPTTGPLLPWVPSKSCHAFPLPSLPRKQPTVLVVCGPAQNGAIGLVCARHLRIFDYEPTIFYPKRSPDPLYRDFTTQCEKMDIPFLSYLPTEVQLINDAYNAVVDAVLGAEAEAAEGREPCAAILATLKHVRIPIVSLDVPSGWDVEAGSSGGISPDVLVSLSAPKQCARRFLGRQHFVAGRFLPYDVQKKFELNPPKYPGTECVVAL